MRISPIRPKYIVVTLYSALFFSCLFCTVKISQAQPPVPPPQKVWVSLDYSTLDEKSPDWEWLHAQCAGGHALKTLEPAQDKIGALIVPIFDDGRCFFTTTVEPFKGRNPNAKNDEQALRELLTKARQAGVPVYFGLDMLAWQKTSLDKKSGIFNALPAFQEINKDFARSPDPEALYASPFNEKVRGILNSLVKEIASKFPEASGVVFDLHLSNREMLGFSEAARAASMIDVGIDPVDLSLTEAAVEGTTTQLQRYVQWRHEVMTSFLKSLVETYRAHHKEGQVFASGSADYYTQRDLNNRRIVQDWMAWVAAGVVDGVLLEGRWLPRYSAADQFVDLMKQFNGIPKKEEKPAALIPATTGSLLVKDSNYQRDWTILKSRVTSLDTFAVVTYSDDDLKQVVALASGRVTLSQLPIQTPKVNEIAPEFTLADASGKRWSSREIRWKSASMLLLSQTTPTLLLQDLTTAGENLRRQGVEPIVISGETATSRFQASFPILADKAHELVPLFGDGPTIVTIDRAGFIRQIAKTQEPRAFTETIQKISDPTPVLEIGRLAPDFSVVDMNGNTVRLADFRGRKNMLLTFFPKCFTSGCAGHLGSLRDKYSSFQDNDTVIFAVSVDPADVQIAFAKSLGIEFPLIPDTGRNLCVLYGAVANVPGNSTALAARQTILINKNGIVRLIDKKVNIATHAADMLSRMRELGLMKQVGTQ